MFLKKLAVCISLVILSVNPAMASQTQIFSADYYHADEDKQCADIARFAAASTKQPSVRLTFINEWSKRSIAPVNGAFISSAFDKALYTSVAAHAESDQQRIGVNGIPTSEQGMMAYCKSQYEFIMKTLNVERSDEISQARASRNQPTSSELILGERDYKNIISACELSTRNTHTDVMMALHATKTPYDAKQLYYGKPHTYDLMYGRTPLDNPQFRFLPALHRFQGLIKDVNRQYEDELFAGKDDKGFADDLTQKCIKSSTDFWVQNL